MIKLTHTSELEEALKNSGRAVLLFTAEWCSQCKPLKRQIGHLPVIEVDADKFVELATRYEVRGLPTVVELVRDVTDPHQLDQERSWTGQALKASIVKGLFE